MKKFIYLMKQINSSFLTSEIDEFKREFDEIFVITYGEDRKMCDEISREYCVKYALISDAYFGLKTISRCRKWKNQDCVKYELKRFKSIKFDKYKRKPHIYYYEKNAVKFNRIIEDSLTDECKKVKCVLSKELSVVKHFFLRQYILWNFDILHAVFARRTVNMVRILLYNTCIYRF